MGGGGGEDKEAALIRGLHCVRQYDAPKYN